MIWIISFFILLPFVANYIYKHIVLRDTQEEQIIRGSKKKDAYDFSSFGSSYARYAFDFSATSYSGFNFGLLPQFLYYTEKMIRDYRSCYRHNAYILIILPDLVFGDPGKGKYGAKRYAKLLSRKIQEDEFNWKNHLFVNLFPLLNPSRTNLKNCIRNIWLCPKSAKEYLVEKNLLTEDQVEEEAVKRCRSWIKEFNLVDTETDDIPIDLEQNFMESRKILTRIIAYCLKEKLRPALIVTPVSDVMKRHLSDKFLKKVLYDNIKLANTYNVPVLDYLTDKRFSAISNYCNNADFLNASARRRFTDIVIDDVMNVYKELL